MWGNKITMARHSSSFSSCPVHHRRRKGRKTITNKLFSKGLKWTRQRRYTTKTPTPTPLKRLPRQITDKTLLEERQVQMFLFSFRAAKYKKSHWGRHRSRHSRWRPSVTNRLFVSATTTALLSCLVFFLSNSFLVSIFFLFLLLLFFKFLLFFYNNRTNTVWIGVMQLSGSWLWAPLVVALCRRKSTRLTAVLGGLVLALAALFASFAQQIHQVFLR